MLRNKAVNQALEFGTIYVSGWYLGLGWIKDIWPTHSIPQPKRGALGDIPTCSVSTAIRADGSDLLVRNFIYFPISYFSSLTWYSEGQFSSVQSLSCPTLCDPMNRSTPGLPVQLLEFTQTHVHRVGDAIQPSHPLLPRSPPAPNPSQHQSLYQWVNSLHQVAKVLEFQL